MLIKGKHSELPFRVCFRKEDLSLGNIFVSIDFFQENYGILLVNNKQMRNDKGSLFNTHL